MSQTEKLVAMQLLKKYMIPVIAKQRQCNLEKAEVSFNKDCEDVEGKEMLNAFLSAMEEYAQQSQSNPSKLVEALKNIAKECTSNEVSISFIEHEAKEALSEYATEEVTRVNPYKDLKCKYVYDYCNPETCTCSKSWRWEVENNKAQQALESYKERLIIAGALIAAEIDRLQNQ